MLGGLLVLIKRRGGDPRGQQFDLFAATGPSPLLGLRGPRGQRELRVQRQERRHPLGPGAAGRHRRRPLPCRPVTVAAGALPGGTLVAGWAAREAAGLAVGLADGAVAAGATLTLELPLPCPGDTGPGPREAEANTGLGDDLDQPGSPATQMLRQPPVQVLRPAGVMADMLVPLVEMQQVHRPTGMPPRARGRGRGSGVSGHGRPPPCPWPSQAAAGAPAPAGERRGGSPARGCGRPDGWPVPGRGWPGVGGGHASAARDW
jgi:hypothetical protein